MYEPKAPGLNPGVESLLDAALAYAARGWSIIPVVGKKPSGLWKPFQDRAADKATLRRLFAKKAITGLAVIAGRVSGGLAVRDFDQAAAYLAWAKAHPDDAARLPTVQTARGFHVYGRLRDEQYHVLGDGELRADSKHYVLVPPSLHPDGCTYTWTIPLPPLGQRLPRLPKSLTQRQPKQTTQDNPRQPTACAHDDLDRVIAGNLPPAPGHRNRCLFNLARALKGLVPDAAPNNFVPFSPAGTARRFHESAPRISQPPGAISYALERG